MQQCQEMAFRAGISLDDLEGLLRGNAYFTVQQRLGVPMEKINGFINRNQTSADLIARLGIPLITAQRLGASLGREGRIGLILGLLVE